LWEFPADHLDTVIRRGIVHDDDLEVDIALAVDIRKKRKHAITAVVTWNDDAEHGD
jgi:hypothetical protein